MFPTFRIKGLVAAVFTPFDENGEVNTEVIPAYSDHLNSQGVTNVFVNGTTGEGLSLSIKERKLTAEAWCNVKPGKFDHIVINVGAESLKDSMELACHASNLVGVSAIAVMAPTFFKANDNASLIEFCGQVSNSAPNLPFYYYHLPGMTGIKLNMTAFMKEAAEEIPALVGIKFSEPDLLTASFLQHQGHNVLWGVDEMFHSAMCLNLDGVIGSTYNFQGSLNHEIYKAIQEKEHEKANELQYKALKNINVIFKNGPVNLSSMKAVMALKGLNLGNPRSPLPSLTEENIKQMRLELEDIGFL